MLTFTDAGIEPDSIEDRRDDEPESTSVRSGPFLRFRLILGEGRPWRSREWLLWEEMEDGMFRCGGCGGKELARYAYCLCCERSGMDAKIAPATPDQLRRLGRIRAYRPGEEGLAGGTEAKGP